MFIGTVCISLLLAVLCCHAAARKLSHRDDVVAAYARVGVPEARLNLLAVILYLGAAGLVVGLFSPPIGIAAASGLGVYFVLAVIAHVRARDTANMPTPVLMMALAMAVLVLRVVGA